MSLSVELAADIKSTYGRVVGSELWRKGSALHAHVESRLCWLLGLAQARQRVPPSSFLWLKAADRPLWYALHSVGMLPAAVECAGIRALMREEAAAGAALPSPKVDLAVQALYHELAFDNWQPPKGADISEASAVVTALAAR